MNLENFTDSDAEMDSINAETKRLQEQTQFHSVNTDTESEDVCLF